ncbi:hypothetical protein R1flu_002633 [Riccia fluitans]|uniref:Uncharacterized protein n=1 Tax=Riccia fluitans TaxID=41844 RepID=A0ABD1Y6X6_9MARC
MLLVLGSADGENANTIVSNADGRPGPTSRPTNSGCGTDRPNGKDRGKKRNLSKQRTQASRPRPSVANASSARSPPTVGSDLPTPIENSETPGGNTDPAPTQPSLNTSEEDNEEESGSSRARWGSLEVRLLIEGKKLEYAQLDNSGSRDVIVNATTKWNRIADHLRAQGYNAQAQDERKEADLPATFDQEWIELLDTFMVDRPCQKPPFVADSSAADMAIDDSEIPSTQEREHRMTSKRKHAVGENTRFLVLGLNSGLKESMDTLATAMNDCEKMRLKTNKM